MGCGYHWKKRTSFISYIDCGGALAAPLTGKHWTTPESGKVKWLAVEHD